MKITMKELRSLIREAVEQQIQQEGFADKVGAFFGVNQDVTSDKSFVSLFNDAIKETLETTLKSAQRHYRPQTLRPWDVEKMVKEALQRIKEQIGQDPKNLEVALKSALEFGGPKSNTFLAKVKELRSTGKWKPTQKDIQRLHGSLDNWFVSVPSFVKDSPNAQYFIGAPTTGSVYEARSRKKKGLTAHNKR